jgi:hypothetical protein
MSTESIRHALAALRVAEARTRACERGSAARAAAVIDEERASKAVWDAAADGDGPEPRAAPH